MNVERRQSLTRPVPLSDPDEGSDVLWYVREVARSARRASRLGLLLKLLVDAAKTRRRRCRSAVEGELGWFGRAILHSSLSANIPIRVPPDFDDEAYLDRYADVRQRVEAGKLSSGFAHYVLHGRREGRYRATILEPRPGEAGGRNAPLRHAGFARDTGASSSASVFEAYARQLFGASRPLVETGSEYVPKSEEALEAAHAPLQLVAFYLPQFHPIPENDAWWGSGFTEWTNVSKAVPQYLGHYQPHLPGELGFYDLRLVDVMRQQVDLARHYGIGGFCFHHYWFAGKRLLERPVNQLLEAKDIDFPFCLCWANENWTRRWDGQDDDILVAQRHSPEDDLAFIEDVLPALRDERYIRFNGKPVLVVYRVSLLPDAAATAARWRKRCMEAGVGDLYLVAARSFEVTDPRPYGFDAAVEFPPLQRPGPRINDKLTVVNPDYGGAIFDYANVAQTFSEQRASGYPLIKAVMPSWDNEPRKPGAGHVFHGSSPAAYGRWLHNVYAIDRAEGGG